MSVFYVGPYRQKDSWGSTSRNYLKVLSKHVDVVARPVYYNNVKGSAEIDTDLEELESKELEERDIIIQHGLPYNLVYDGSFNQNIAITSISSCIANTSWVANLNLFDKIIVFSEAEKEMLLESGVTVDVYAFGFPPYYETKIEITDLPLASRGKTLFYTSGSFKENSSGLKETLMAYFSEFSVQEDVLMVVFTEDQDAGKKIDDMKKSLGKFQRDSHYPTVALINNTQESVINYAHKFFQCYVDASYGGVPDSHILKATIFNKIVITLDTAKLYSEHYDFYIESQEEVVSVNSRPLPGLLSGEFTWMVPNTKSLRNKLRLAYSSDKAELKKNKDLVAEVGVGMVTLVDKWTKESLCIQ